MPAVQAFDEDPFITQCFLTLIVLGCAPVRALVTHCLISAQDARHHSASVFALIAVCDVSLDHYWSSFTFAKSATPRLLLYCRSWHAHCSKTLAPESCKVTSCYDYSFPLHTAVSAASSRIQGSTRRKHCYVYVHPHIYIACTALLLLLKSQIKCYLTHSDGL